MLLLILSIVKAVVLFIIKALFVGGGLFLLLSLIATQIMDIYEVRTGESWEDRCRRIKEEKSHE